MCTRQKQAHILHEAGGHRNARDTYRDLEAAGVQVNHISLITLPKGSSAGPGVDLERSTIIDPLNPKIIDPLNPKIMLTERP